MWRDDRRKVEFPKATSVGMAETAQSTNPGHGPGVVLDVFNFRDRFVDDPAPLSSGTMIVSKCPVATLARISFVTSVRPDASRTLRLRSATLGIASQNSCWARR